MTEVRNAVKIEAYYVPRGGERTRGRDFDIVTGRDCWVAGKVTNTSPRPLKNLVLEESVDVGHPESVRTEVKGDLHLGYLRIEIGSLDPGSSATFERFVKSGTDDQGRARPVFLTEKAYPTLVEGEFADGR